MIVIIIVIVIAIPIIIISYQVISSVAIGGELLPGFQENLKRKKTPYTEIQIFRYEKKTVKILGMAVKR